MRRTFAKDVEQCLKCQGRLRLVQTITEPAVATAILEHLGIRLDRLCDLFACAYACRMRLGRLAAILTGPLFALSTFSRSASAGGIGLDGLQALPPTGWFLPVGLNVGVAGLGRTAKGAVLGGEVSIVRVPKDFGGWIGAYADGGYITGRSAARFSAGPEVGLAIFGLDGGFLYVVEHGKSLVGFCLRPMLTVGFVSIYGRWDHLLSGGGGNDGQLGVLLKFPIPLEGQHF